MADSALQVGPMDPDKAGELVGRMGVHNNARRLLQRHAAANPPELVGALRKPTDELRTAALDPEEVAKAADKSGVKGKVVGASVRGARDVADEDRVLVVTVVAESGRSFRTVLSFAKAKLSKSEQRYEKLHRLRLGLDSTAAQLAGGGLDASDVSAPADAKEAEALREEVLRLERELEEAQDAGPPEPYEDFAADSVDEVKDAIDAESDPVERELLKRQIRSYEEAQEKPRKGVLEATEPVALVPATPDE